MNKTDTGMGAGMVLLMAVCCGAKLLLVGFGLSGLAILSGQTALIATAGVVTVAIVGFLVWRRSSGCAMGSRQPPTPQPADRAAARDSESSMSPTPRDLVGAGTASPPPRERVQG